MIDEYTLEDSLRLLANNYHKILKVNLTDDTHTELKMHDNERSSDKGYSDKISEWLKGFALTGQVEKSDVDTYLKFTDINNIRRHFEKSDEIMRFRYRRKTDGKFKWVLMEIMKSSEYTENKQIVILYIQDVHDSYVKELEHHKELEFYCNYDTMTGLANFYSYRSFCHSFSESLCDKPVGVMFGDLNRLKYINDTEGHEAGNKYIKNFAEKLKKIFIGFNCYRVSGDEFIVVYSGESKDEFYSKVEEFEALIKSDKIPTASIGYAYDTTSELEKVTTVAEQMMYADKQAFYEKFPKFKRAIAEANFKNEMDALVKILTDSYEALLLIDLDLDEYRIMKKSLTSVMEKEDDRGVYSIRNMYFSRTYVASEYQKLREEVGSIENLKNRLLEENHITCTYKLGNGKWREAVFWRMEISSVGEVSKVIYYSQDIDASMAERLEAKEEMTDEFQLIAGLREEYSMIGSISTDSNRIKLNDVYSTPIDAYKKIKDVQINEAVAIIANEIIVPEERGDFLCKIKLDNIVSELKNKPLLSYFFHGINSEGKTASYRFNFCYEYNDNSIITVAVKDITDIIEWSNSFK